jgi:ubiquinone/menaquinone biosynthesis C-methylase UbiE
MKVSAFNPVAKAYSRKVVPRRFAQFLTLIHELDLSGRERVLDVGSGPGELSLRIANQLEAGGFLHGVDLSPNMVRLARRSAAEHGHENVSFDTGDALSLNFKDSSFDVVVSSNAFPWVGDQKAFLKEVVRVLRPAGRLGLVTVSNRCYREFAEVFRTVAKKHPKLLPQPKPFKVLGSKGHTLVEAIRLVQTAGLAVQNSFVLATESPVGPLDYLERVNAILNESYLSHLKKESDRKRVHDLLYTGLAKRGRSLHITESFCFVIAQKAAGAESIQYRKAG